MSLTRIASTAVGTIGSTANGAARDWLIAGVLAYFRHIGTSAPALSCWAWTGEESGRRAGASAARQCSTFGTASGVKPLHLHAPRLDSPSGTR